MIGRAGRRRAWRTAAAAAVLVVSGAVSGPASAAAQDPPPLRCSEVGNNLIDWSPPGDLVVDDTEGTCIIFRASVRGDVTVLPGASFSVQRASVDGDIRSAGALTVHESTIGGDVVLESSDTATLEAAPVEGWPSTFHGDVTGEAVDVRLERADVWGTYDVAVRDTTRIRDGARLIGPATVRGGRLLVHDATFLNGLTTSGSGDVLVCRTNVAGDLRVTALTDYARLGVEVAERYWQCATTVSGDLVLEDNPHSVDLGQIGVAGDLVCTGNSGPRGVTLHPYGTHVHGTRTGQCAP